MEKEEDTPAEVASREYQQQKLSGEVKLTVQDADRLRAQKEEYVEKSNMVRTNSVRFFETLADELRAELEGMSKKERKKHAQIETDAKETAGVGVQLSAIREMERAAEVGQRRVELDMQYQMRMASHPEEAIILSPEAQRAIWLERDEALFHQTRQELGLEPKVFQEMRTRKAKEGGSGGDGKSST